MQHMKTLQCSQLIAVSATVEAQRAYPLPQAFSRNRKLERHRLPTADYRVLYERPCSRPLIPGADGTSRAHVPAGCTTVREGCEDAGEDGTDKYRRLGCPHRDRMRHFPGPRPAPAPEHAKTSSALAARRTLARRRACQRSLAEPDCGLRDSPAPANHNRP